MGGGAALKSQTLVKAAHRPEPTRDDGYTLAEALAALLIIGLAIGGLLEGFSVISRMQLAATTSVSDARASRAASQGLGRLLAGAGPYLSDMRSFEGAASVLDFDCAGGARCGAVLQTNGADAILNFSRNDVTAERVVLRGASNARFVFDSDLGRSPIWPPAVQAPGLRLTLRGVSVVVATPNGDMPLAHARLWREQPVDCAFDMISQDCRR